MDGPALSSRDKASEAMPNADFALQQVSGLRSEQGAVQNRFGSTIASLSGGADPRADPAVGEYVDPFAG